MHDRCRAGWRALIKSLGCYLAIAVVLGAGFAYAAMSDSTVRPADIAVSGSETAVLRAAMVAAAASIGAAALALAGVVFNEFRRRANDRKIAQWNIALQEHLIRLKRENDLELERVSVGLKTQIDLVLAEYNTVAERNMSAEAARRSYEYEARKRLYFDCEPLLFVSLR